jgi:pyrroline-5-carboxylate reductase
LPACHARPLVGQDARSQAEAVLRRSAVMVGGRQSPAGCGHRGVRRPGLRVLFHRGARSRGGGTGLAPETARQWRCRTFFGAAKLALESGEEPALLRERVTSKGGTTERGIAALEAAAVRQAIAQAVDAASRRSAELGDELGRLA